MIQEKLRELKRELAGYAGMVEEMIARSIKGLLTRDRHLCEEVIQKEEPRANDWEITIDRMCTNVIAQFEPVARDLRTTLMVLKAGNDLERMADHAVNICESALFLIERPPVKPFIDLPEMAQIASGMLRDAISSFVAEDARLAHEVCERDDTVDHLRDRIFAELITFMTADARTIERAVHILRISENLERIADLSTNISEDTIFMVEGRIIKHHHGDSGQARFPKRILFVCVENSCRSQMAEGFARAMGGSNVAAYSAGSSPSGVVNPDAIAAMAEAGIDISRQHSKGFDALPIDEADILVTVGCEKTCPAFPAREYVAWEIEDPKGKGQEAFRKVRDEIRRRVQHLLESSVQNT